MSAIGHALTLCIQFLAPCNDISVSRQSLWCRATCRTLNQHEVCIFVYDMPISSCYLTYKNLMCLSVSAGLCVMQQIWYQLWDHSPQRPWCHSRLHSLCGCKWARAMCSGHSWRPDHWLCLTLSARTNIGQVRIAAFLCSWFIPQKRAHTIQISITLWAIYTLLGFDIPKESYCVVGIIG